MTGSEDVDLDTELAVDPGDGHVEMGVTQTGENGLTGVGAALDTDRRVLFLDPMEGRGEFLLVVVGPRGDRDLGDGPGIGDRGDGDVAATRSQRVADSQVVDFGHCTDSPGGEIRHIVVLLSLELEEVVQPHLSATGHVELLVCLDRARVDAKQGNSPHEWIGDGFEDESDGRPLRRRRYRIATAQGGKGALERIGPVVDDELGEQVDADESLGRGDEDWLDVTGDDPLVDSGNDLLPGRLSALEVGLHHLVVCLDNRFDQGGVRCVDKVLDLGGQVDLLARRLSLRVLIGTLGGDAHDTPEAFLAADRHLDRGDRLPEGFP